MQTPTASTRRMLWYLWLLCILMPLLCVWVAGSVFWAATQRSWVVAELSGVWMVNSAFVAAPFVLLAIMATTAARHASPTFHRAFGGASLIGVLATLLLWAVVYFDGYTYWSQHKT